MVDAERAADLAGSGLSPSVAPAGSRWILAATILASSLAFVDGSVVNVGLPAIGADLPEGGVSLAWVVNGYLLPLSALLLIGGAAGDRYGRRRLLVSGTALFALASLWCALAPGLPWLIAGRVLQGIGAALLLPNSLATLGAAFSGEARGKAVGTWAAVGAAAGAGGPLLGGWLIDAVGWRAIFLINLPIAAAAIVLAWRHVPNQPDASRQPLDVAGGVLASAALAGLTWGLTACSAAGSASAPALHAVGTGLLALGAFLVVERRRGERAMLPLALFGSADFVGLSLLTLLLYGALGGVLVAVPYVLIELRGYSAAAAGAALLPLPLVLSATSSAAGRLAGRIGARRPLMVGPLLVAAGCLLALRIPQAGSYAAQVLPALTVIALGMAAAVAPLTTAVLQAASARHSGVASGFNSAIARTGGLVATALLGGLLGRHGAALSGAFEVAAWCAAAASLAASAAAWRWVGRRPGSAP